jgi:hypothetical protein
MVGSEGSMLGSWPEAAVAGQLIVCVMWMGVGTGHLHLLVVARLQPEAALVCRLLSTSRTCASTCIFGVGMTTLAQVISQHDSPLDNQLSICYTTITQ